MRQGRARQQRTRAQSSALRTALKRVRTATTPQQASEAYRVAARLLDRAARKNLIHHNKAARNKSRLAAVVRKLSKYLRRVFRFRRRRADRHTARNTTLSAGSSCRTLCTGGSARLPRRRPRTGRGRSAQGQGWRPAATAARRCGADRLGSRAETAPRWRAEAKERSPWRPQ